MTPKRLIIPALLTLSVTVAACNTKPVGFNEYNDPRFQTPGTGQALGDQGLVLFGGKSNTNQNDTGGALGVNAYLWRAALDTLSFMPLASADPFGGVIITDWYQPPSTPGERFKATAYILGRQLRSDGLRVVIYRQELQDGQWMDAPVTATTRADIEDKVLARARDLRAQSTASN
jgi:hypothetical protein